MSGVRDSPGIAVRLAGASFLKGGDGMFPILIDRIMLATLHALLCHDYLAVARRENVKLGVVPVIVQRARM